MNFEFGPPETDLFDNVLAAMQALEKERSLETSDQPENEANVREALVRLGDLGYLPLGLRSDPEGLKGTLSLMGAMETVALVSPSVYLAIEMSTRVFGRVLSTWSDAEQQERWLAPLIKGQILGGVALSESALNIDNDPLQTTGRWEDKAIVVSGQKTYVVNGAIADWIAVAGLMEKQPAFFLLETGSPGLKIAPRCNTLGYEGTVINDLTLDKCRVPSRQIIGPFENEPVLETIRLWENQILLGASLGLMQAAFQAAKNYANEHHTGGKPIIAYQEVAFKLAEMLTLLQTSQLLAYRAAWTADTDPREARSLTWCAKVFCTEAAEKVASSALQILAGAGFTSGNVAERAYRCAKYGQIAGTSTEIARVKIGDAALGLR